MTDTTEEKADIQEPDNSKMKNLDASEFEVTADRLEQLMKSMEVLLSDVEQLRSHCSHQAGELMRAAVELRHQQDELKESYAELYKEMQEIVESVEDLFSTKSAFEAKEKQAQKLNRQLWETDGETLFVKHCGQVVLALGFVSCTLKELSFDLQRKLCEILELCLTCRRLCFLIFYLNLRPHML